MIYNFFEIVMIVKHCQVRSAHGGRYCCSVPGYVSAPVRIHIIQGEDEASPQPFISFIIFHFADENHQAFVASGNNIHNWSLVRHYFEIFQYLVVFLFFQYSNILIRLEIKISDIFNKEGQKTSSGEQMCFFSLLAFIDQRIHLNESESTKVLQVQNERAV